MCRLEYVQTVEEKCAHSFLESNVIIYMILKQEYLRSQHLTVARLHIGTQSIHILTFGPIMIRHIILHSLHGDMLLLNLQSFHILSLHLYFVSTIQPLQDPLPYSYFVTSPNKRYKPSSYCKSRCILIRDVNLEFGESPLGFTSTYNLTDEQASTLKRKLKDLPFQIGAGNMSFDWSSLFEDNFNASIDSHIHRQLDFDDATEYTQIPDMHPSSSPSDSDPEEEHIPFTELESATTPSSLQKPRFRTRKTKLPQKGKEDNDFY